MLGTQCILLFTKVNNLAYACSVHVYQCINELRIVLMGRDAKNSYGTSSSHPRQGSPEILCFLSAGGKDELILTCKICFNARV